MSIDSGLLDVAVAYTLDGFFPKILHPTYKFYYTFAPNRACKKHTQTIVTKG